MKVGFIAPGETGAGMSAILLKAGRETTVYNRTRTEVEVIFTQRA